MKRKLILLSLGLGAAIAGASPLFIGEIRLQEITANEQAKTLLNRGEIVLNTDDWTLRIGDGVNTGGVAVVPPASWWSGVRTNMGSLSGITDLSITGWDSRMILGRGLNVTNIGVDAVGAIQAGECWDGTTMSIGYQASGSGQYLANNGSAKIYNNAEGSYQRGYNGGTMTIGRFSSTCTQFGYNDGTMTIGANAYASTQIGENYGLMAIGASDPNISNGVSVNVSASLQIAYNRWGTLIIGDDTAGAVQIGALSSGSIATNSGNGAMQLFDLTEGQVALTTSGGDGSLLLGAGVVSNRYAIVAGDGQSSKGNGSIVAGGGFWGAGTGLTGTGTTFTAGNTLQLGGVAAAYFLTNNTTAAVTLNGNVTLNGTANTMPNQTAAAGASVMTRDLGDARYATIDPFGRNVRMLRDLPFSDCNTSVGNGGVVTTKHPATIYTAGNSASNAFAALYVSSWNTENGTGVSSRNLPWSIEVVGFINTRASVAENAMYVGYFDRSQGLLTNTGWSVVGLSNSLLVASVHNGTSLVSATNGLWSADRHHRIIVTWPGTNTLNVYFAQTNTSAQLSTPQLVASVTNNIGANWGNLSAYNCFWMVHNLATNTSIAFPTWEIRQLKISEWGL